MKDILKSYIVNYSVIFSPCKEYIATSNNLNSIRIIHISTGKESIIYCGESRFGNVYSLKTCDDILICSCDLFLCAWRWSNIIEFANDESILNPIWKIAIPPNHHFPGYFQILSIHVDNRNKVIYTGSSDGSIQSWNISGSEPVHLNSKACKNGAVLSLCGNGNSAIVAGFADGTVKIWDSLTASDCVTINTSADPDVARPKLGTCVNVVATDPNSSEWLLIGGHPRLSLWNVRAGKTSVLFDRDDDQFKESWVPFTAVLNNHKVIAGGSSSRLYLWDISGQLYSEVWLANIKSVYGILPPDDVTVYPQQSSKSAVSSNDVIVCGIGCPIELYSNMGYKKKSFTF